MQPYMLEKLIVAMEGGSDPQTIEEKVAQDAYALKHIGTIGITRAVVRGLNDGYLLTCNSP